MLAVDDLVDAKFPVTELDFAVCPDDSVLPCDLCSSRTRSHGAFPNPRATAWGLAVVSGIVRSLGGSIRIKSDPGKGSAFQVLLPCAEAAGTATIYPVSIEQAASPYRDVVVLVVEDEDPLRSAVVKMLRRTGFEVLEAANGSAAITLLRANGGKIDLILVDMTIPGASSREVVAETTQTRPEVRVVLTSAYSEEISRPAIAASQIRGFIRKPFQFEELVQTLRNIASA